MQLLDAENKSATLKSTQADYTTPPESPVMPHPLFKTVGESLDKPPVPPPRTKRKTPRNETSPPPQSKTDGTDSTAVLEEVAKDLIRMSTEIDQRLSDKVETRVSSEAKITKEEDLLKGIFFARTPFPIIERLGAIRVFEK